MRKVNKRRVFAASVAAIGLAMSPYLYRVVSENPDAAQASLVTAISAIKENAPKAPSVKYGFLLDSFQVVQDQFHNNQTLGDMLSDYGVSEAQISAVSAKSAAIFDVKKLKAGRDYVLLNDLKGAHTPQFLVYEPSSYSYVVYDLRGETGVTEVKRQVDLKLESKSGVVYSDLWTTAEERNIDDKLVDKMQDALKHAFDFHKVKQGDRFKLVYENAYIDGKAVDVGDLRAVYFEKEGDSYYAFKYKHNGNEEFYDFDGTPYKQGFLLAPVKASRIASRFNPNRLHPILGYVRAHTGTDYAAPTGTPIISVADGKIEQACNGGGKGNFVKVRHNQTYQTEYYHMSRFAKGIKPGVSVQQGDVIGYVGQTGLATGPHVCFHLWKNGVQVDHLREKLPKVDPLSKAEFPVFVHHRDSLISVMQQSSFYTKEELSASKLRPRFPLQAVP